MYAVQQRTNSQSNEWKTTLKTHGDDVAYRELIRLRSQRPECARLVRV